MTRILRIVATLAMLTGVVVVVGGPTGAQPAGAHDNYERILFTEACDDAAFNLPVQYISPFNPSEREIAERTTDEGVRVSHSQDLLAVTTFDGIVITKSDGTGGTLLPFTMGAKHPAWSPDDSEVAYLLADRIWVSKVNSSDPPVPVTATVDITATSLDWSYDGATFVWTVFVGAASEPVIESVSATTGVRTTLRAGSHARYEPDGPWIAYTTDDGFVASMDADGTNPNVTTQQGLVGAVSNDGREIAFRDRKMVDGNLVDYIGYWSWYSHDATVVVDGDPLCDTVFYVWDWASPLFPTFADVPLGHLFSEDIEWLVHEGITKGCNPPTNTMYCPEAQLTRGEFAALMVRALDLPQGGTNHFIDDDTSVFENAIDRLASAGITRGCNPPKNDRFCPNGTVTRGQIAAFLVRAFDFTDNGGGDLFTDDDDSVFENDIDKLATAGVTRGCNPPANTRFCPNNPITRAQIAAMLHRELG